jgi:hypothetical protein
MSQAQTKNPTLIHLTRYGTAGSYGQTTFLSNTAPTNTPGGGNAFGAY